MEALLKKLARGVLPHPVRHLIRSVTGTARPAPPLAALPEPPSATTPSATPRAAEPAPYQRQMHGALAPNVYASDFPRTAGDNSFLSHSYGEFDEWGYLLFNCDIAQMVRCGVWPSGRAHYEAYGAEEVRTGRRPPVPDYREMSYLLRNPDLFHLVCTGQLESGRKHYELSGRAEELAGRRRPYISAEPRHVLTAEQRQTWEQGYLHLKGFFSEAEIDAVNERLARLWRDRAKDRRPIDVDYFLGEPRSATTALRDVPDEARLLPHKINNLYYWDDLIRGMVLDGRLATVVRALIDGDPCALTSLNFERGSEQPLHLDTFYMPPVVPYRMVATWTALEDAVPEAGPLQYVPGSNRIPPFVFGHGHVRWNIPEMMEFNLYMNAQIEKRGLKVLEFCPKKGDVFIWHPLLFHGGSKILNPDKTRRSLVAHYFSAADYPLGSISQANNIIMHDAGRYYENRISLTVPAAQAQLSWPGA
jgi:hypothetical protein